MTLLQIKYAVYCAQFLSINKAAEQLFTTPSNVSKSIKALENELGYSIFMRNNNGLIVTNVGTKFIQIANSIVSDCEKLTSLAEDDFGDTLSVCYNQISFVRKAFVRFCSIMADDNPEIHLKLLQGNYAQCIDYLRNNICQLAILSFISGGASEYLNEGKSRDITANLLAKANATLVIRKDHPIFKDAAPDNFDTQKLLSYPYANYMISEHGEEILSPFQVGGDLWPVNPNKIIIVNSMDEKVNLARNTNAYTFVSTSLKSITSWENLYLIPNPDRHFHYYYVYCTKEPPTNNTLRFLELLKEELRSTPTPLG
ncbi:MAG: LysR family transcriptional regulator [Mogibacterium sp.]|nr:LysR family transcriptional regulator [Mogibacterium sp.]